MATTTSIAARLRTWAAVDRIHPELRSAARLLPSSFIGARSLGPIRALSSLQRRGSPAGVEIVEVGEVAVRVHRPANIDGDVPGLVWVHGGGYVMGTAAQDDRLCRHFAKHVGMVVASVDYRLAPEHKFPVPLEDCYAALDWLARQPGVDGERIAVGGGSAGGGLAAALALLARDRGEHRLAFQLLVYPMLDDRTANRSDVDERGFRLWNNKSNRFGWEAYTGEPPGSPGLSAPAVPARAGMAELAGLPPAWIGVGTLDLFHDEDVAYAARLRDAGVPCELQVVEGAFHGFDTVRPKSAVSEAFRAAQTKALAAALSR